MNATIDAQTGNIIYQNTVSKTFDDVNVAMTVYRIALSLEIQAAIATDHDDATGKDVFIVTLTNVTQDQIGLLERKTAITNWSAAATQVANNVTNALTQVGDYALNGALAPTVTAVANAGFTTARVALTAATRIATGTVASLAFNTRVMTKEIGNSKELSSCMSEVSQCFKDAGKGFAKLFGVNMQGNGGWTDASVPAQNSTGTAA